MRITSGVLKNRRFNVPKEEVRPTMESVREAVFSALGGSCEGLKVLDLFAGSGALGLEAWSRGAESVTFVEKNSSVWKNLRENIQRLEAPGLGGTRCIKADAVRWLERSGERFDLVLADPPYDLPNALQETLGGIAGHSVLTDGGRVVYELRSKGGFEIPEEWEILRDKTYGKTRVLMLQPNRKDRP